MLTEAKPDVSPAEEFTSATISTFVPQGKFFTHLLARFFTNSPQSPLPALATCTHDSHGMSFISLNYLLPLAFGLELCVSLHLDYSLLHIVFVANCYIYFRLPLHGIF